MTEAQTDAPTAPHCLVEQDGHKLIVTMNRPETRNALSGEMLAIMEEAWDRVNTDDDIRVCILTGAGGYFCAGMDLKAATKRHRRTTASSPASTRSVLKGLLKGFRLTKPLIAAVEGPAIAGGTEILQGTDIRIAGRVRPASASPRPGGASTRWAAPPYGSPGRSRYTLAVDLLLTGRAIKAPEAKEIGLIGHVVPDGRRPGQGPRDRRPDLRQRPARRPGHPQDRPRLRGQARGGLLGRRREGRQGRLRLQRRQGGPRAFAEKRAPRFTGS